MPGQELKPGNRKRDSKRTGEPGIAGDNATKGPKKWTLLAEQLHAHGVSNWNEIANSLSSGGQVEVMENDFNERQYFGDHVRKASSDDQPKQKPIPNWQDRTEFPTPAEAYSTSSKQSVSGSESSYVMVVDPADLSSPRSDDSVRVRVQANESTNPWHGDGAKAMVQNLSQAPALTYRKA